MAVVRVHDVAFIGTGIMGAPICEHIMEAGYSLTVYNRSKERAEHLIEKGAAWADSPAAAAAKADVVFTMLGFPDDVEEVYFGKNGLLEGSKKGAWLVDLTTSAPELARELHDAAEVMDKHSFDCPVTGGQSGAQDGTLTLMVGADEQTTAILRPLLESFSSKIYYFGKAGDGQAAKLCNQVSLASCMVGYADALALAKQSGLDLDQIVDVMCDGMGGSVAMERLAPKSVEGDFRPGFLSEHMRKDIALALRHAEDLDLKLPGAETAFNLYDVLCQIGGKRLGTQAISVLYEDEAEAAAAGLDWSLIEPAADDAHEHHHCHHHHHGEE
ncbi:NAD(P)-dependent oxidoreductase [Parafannyhessea umbonata]|uniref:3-hydroxyisobutyrate dehydrogenase n=1 Tax=Parafannyhessea umbonata TaxID=604330 RepID=A0A1H9N1Q3_9ACTN|nr:NAD(P)-dependent oxidoreductase [Parafannyhessea umbonata]SER29741.1 3-hydroxyisobutyrate dehydrogenase [Parafannyhessea umbonata]